MSENREVVFVCMKYPMLRMVFKVDTTTIINNQVVRHPEEYIGFIKTSFGGTYKTSDPAKIKYIRDSELYKEGLIEEYEAADLEKAMADHEPLDEHPVHVGAIGSGPRAPQVATPAPQKSTPQPVPAAKVPTRQ